MLHCCWPLKIPSQISFIWSLVSGLMPSAPFLIVKEFHTIAFCRLKNLLSSWARSQLYLLVALQRCTCYSSRALFISSLALLFPHQYRCFVMGTGSLSYVSCPSGGCFGGLGATSSWHPYWYFTGGAHKLALGPIPSTHPTEGGRRE